MVPRTKAPLKGLWRRAPHKPVALIRKQPEVEPILRQGILIQRVHVGESCTAWKNYSTQLPDSSVWVGKNLVKEAAYFPERNAKNHSSLQGSTPRLQPGMGMLICQCWYLGRRAGGRLGSRSLRLSLGNTVMLLCQNE